MLHLKAANKKNLLTNIASHHVAMAAKILGILPIISPTKIVLSIPQFWHLCTILATTHSDFTPCQRTLDHSLTSYIELCSRLLCRIRIYVSSCLFDVCSYHIICHWLWSYFVDIWIMEESWGEGHFWYATPVFHSHALLLNPTHSLTHSLDHICYEVCKWFRSAVISWIGVGSTDQIWVCIYT